MYPDRRRQNPLYDSVEHGEAPDYKSKRRKTETCPCLIQLIIGAIAVTALILAVISLVGSTDDDDDGENTVKNTRPSPVPNLN